MLKIEERRRKTSDGEEGYLVVNGEPIENSHTFVLHESERYGYVYDEEAAASLARYRFNDIRPHFTELTLPFDVDWNDLVGGVEIRLRDYDNKNIRRLRFEFKTSWEDWAKPYSIAEYVETLQKTTRKFKKLGLRFYQDDEWILSGFGLECTFTSSSAVIQNEISRWGEKLGVISNAVTDRLAETARTDSLVTYFAFPQAAKAACEQYLLYFIQFLKDLGIEANAEIKEDARRVLFSVTPADGRSALTRVREALDVYLRLPGTPDFGETAGQYPNVAVQQLHANVLHLKSQLVLAKAASQVQNATIETLQLSNFQYRRLLSADSAPPPKPLDEPLVGDTVHLKKYDGKIVKVDLPVILRRLKRVFGVGREKPL